MTESGGLSLEEKCLGLARSLAKTLGRLALYQAGHPAVAEEIERLDGELKGLLREVPEGEILFSIDGDLLVANGRPLAEAASFPAAFTAIFKRFKINLLSFKSGVSRKELEVFCDLCLSRPGSRAEQEPQAYLREFGVVRVTINEAVYAKLAESPAASGSAPPSRPSSNAAPGSAVSAAADSGSLDALLKALIDRSVPEAAERERIYKIVSALIEQDMQRRIGEAVRKEEAEKAVAINEQARTQNVLGAMMEGSIVVDDQGKILMMNPAAENVYGLGLSEAAGLPIEVGEGRLIALASAIGALTPEDRSAPASVSGAAEFSRALRASGAVVQNEAGKVVGVALAPPDAAKLKEIEGLKRDFVAHVTHELRAPLSSIKAALEMLEGRVGASAAPEDARLIETARKNGDRLSGLITSILDFSKIESGQMTVYPKKEDPARLAEEAHESLAAWARKKNLEWSLSLEPALPSVLADGPRTVQVLINLLSNAIKFTPEKGRVALKVEPPKAQGGFVLFSVSDTGCGIAPKDQERVFEKFAQIVSGQASVQGTGLGLSIAKALAHLQGGRLWLESAAGRGATFFLALPVFFERRESVKKRARMPWWKRWPFYR